MHRFVEAFSLRNSFMRSLLTFSGCEHAKTRSFPMSSSSEMPSATYLFSASEAEASRTKSNFPAADCDGA